MHAVVHMAAVGVFCTKLVQGPQCLPYQDQMATSQITQAQHTCPKTYAPSRCCRAFCGCPADTVRLTTQMSCSSAAGATAHMVDVCQAAVQEGRCCQDAELRACTLVLRGVANTCLYSLTPRKQKQRQNTKNTPAKSWPTTLHCAPAIPDVLRPGSWGEVAATTLIPGSHCHDTGWRGHGGCRTAVC